MNRFNKGPRKSSGERSGSSRRDFSGSSRGGQRSFGENRGSFNRSFDQREMHKATCSECKKECEVPFKPTEGKPVFCKECYFKNKKF